MNYTLVWSELASLLLVDCWSQSFIRARQYPWNEVDDSVIFIRGRGGAQAYISVRDQERIDTFHGNYFIDKKNVTFLLETYSGLVERFYEFVTMIRELDVSEYSRKQLLPLFVSYFDILFDITAWFRGTRPEAELAPKEILLRALTEKFSTENEVQEVFRIITQSPKLDVLKKENVAWLTLAEQDFVSDQELLDHAYRCPSLYQNVYSIDDVVGFLRKRLQETQRNLKKEQEDMRTVLRNLDALKKRQDALFADLNDPVITEMSFFFQEFSIARLDLKECWVGAELLCLSLFERVVCLIGISIDDFFSTYTVQDVFNFLRHNETLSQKKLHLRSECVVHRVQDAEMRLLEGEAAHAFIDAHLDMSNRKKVTALGGTSAHPGVYVGKARVLTSTRMDDLFIEPGEVLVTDMTQPHMVLIMKKAGAIVTNVGGITSHAAVMSREFGIPCVVGTLRATQVIKDGDLIEVDANEGCVRRIG